MPDPQWFQTVLEKVRERGFLRAPRSINKSSERGEVAASIEGEIGVEDREVTLQLALLASFPETLPHIYLKQWDTLGFIPHVDTDGYICYADPEGLILDRQRPVEVIQEALDRAVHVLAAGTRGQNNQDFVNEFEDYWVRLKGGIVALSILEPTDEARDVVFATDHKHDRHYVAESEHAILQFYTGSNVTQSLTVEKAIYLPLESGAHIIPPRPDGSGWTAAKVREVLLPHLSKENQVRLKRLIKRKRSAKYVIVSLHRFSGGVALFGFRYEGLTSSQHPLSEKGNADQLVPVYLQRAEPSYLIQRGGGQPQLTSKQILLVGCGAVGAHLAFELARAGILQLTLVDDDILMPENSFRHILGRTYWGQKKVHGLKTEMEEHIPYVQVKVWPEEILSLVRRGLIDLSRYDLIILTTGNPTVELALNERIQGLEAGPPALFTWLEPLGIGGHALLTHQGKERGCLECLYTACDDETEYLRNRAAFAAPGQHFGRALAGCATLHTPYGSLDAVQTATLAARLSVDSLTGIERGNPLLSWKGNEAIFVNQGYRLSHRFNLSGTELFSYRYAYPNPACRVCGHDPAAQDNAIT